MSDFKAPWQYEVEDCTVYNSNGDIVCDMLSTGEQWEEDNANLIACAPEMYELLERILANCAGSPVALKINRLLAKARGEHDANS